MHVGRLKRLEALLRADAKNAKGVKFDLSYWAAPSDSLSNAAYPYRQGGFKTRKREIAVDCGTTACALGLAAISGEFKKEGLKHTFFQNDFGFQLEPAIKNPRTRCMATGFEAAEVLFGIDDDQAEFLFAPDRYASVPTGAKGERLVADRIKQFIKSGGVTDRD